MIISVIHKKHKRSVPHAELEEHAFQCFGRLWITRGKDHFLGKNRIVLLEKIDEVGSINTAAKSMNISYKRAWEIVNDIKKVSGKGILECRSGGRGGGGSQLTDFAKTLVRLYRSFENRHQQLIAEMTAEANSLLGIPVISPSPDAPDNPPATGQNTSSLSTHLL